MATLLSNVQRICSDRCTTEMRIMRYEDTGRGWLGNACFFSRNVVRNEFDGDGLENRREG